MSYDYSYLLLITNLFPLFCLRACKVTALFTNYQIFLPFFRGPAMESLGTGRKGAQRGAKGQKEAERGRKGQKGAFPLPAPVPSDSIAGPPKKGKKSLAGVS